MLHGLQMQEHPGLSKSEKKRLCALMDCKKLSADASAHAVQNGRLPLRVVVQVLFFEQVRQSSASATVPTLVPPAQGGRHLVRQLTIRDHNSDRGRTVGRRCGRTGVRVWR